jgi:integrase
VEGAPKSEAGHRDVMLLPEDAAGLKAWKRQQAKERLAWGEGLGELRPGVHEGRRLALAPGHGADTFERLAFAAHLPPVRLHDVRHENITPSFAAGIDVKVIQERVGHSGSKMTRDYAAVSEEVSRAAAEKAASLIPRKAAR